MDFRLLDKAADAFMDIGFRDDGWQNALNVLDGAFGASGCVLLPVENLVPGPIQVSDSGMHGFQTYIRDGWYQNDARFAAIPGMLRHGVATDHDFINESGMARSAYYQECLRPFGWKWFMAIRVDIGNEVWAASLQRSAAQGAFTHSEQEAAIKIATKLSRGATLALSLKQPSVTGMSGFYDHFDTPALLLNRAGQVVHVNRAAEALIGRGMSVIGKRLVVNRDDNGRLQQLISALVAFDEYPSPRACEKVVVRREHGRPLVFSGQTLKVGPAWDYFLEARAILTIADPDRRPATDEDLICRMFGLTRSEAKLCVLFFLNDGDLQKTAAELSLTYNSARTYLRAIFSKMDVSSQAQLLLILARVFERKMG